MKYLLVLSLLLMALTGCGGNEVDTTGMSYLITSKDEADDTTFYFDNRAPSLTGTYFYPYIAEKDGAVWLRLKIVYRTDDLIFIERYVVTTPDRTFTIEPDLIGLGEKVEVDWIDKKSIERFDRFVTSGDLEMLRAVAVSPTTEIRFVGSQSEASYTLTEIERQIAGAILAAYESKKEQ